MKVTRQIRDCAASAIREIVPGKNIEHEPIEKYIKAVFYSKTALLDSSVADQTRVVLIAPALQKAIKEFQSGRSVLLSLCASRRADDKIIISPRPPKLEESRGFVEYRIPAPQHFPDSDLAI